MASSICESIYKVEHSSHLLICLDSALQHLHHAGNVTIWREQHVLLPCIFLKTQVQDCMSHLNVQIRNCCCCPAVLLVLCQCYYRLVESEKKMSIDQSMTCTSHFSFWVSSFMVKSSVRRWTMCQCNTPQSSTVDKLWAVSAASPDQNQQNSKARH